MSRYSLLILIFCCTKVNAQTLSLSSAIELALKNNLSIQIEKNNEYIGKLKNHSGNAGGLPQVTFTASDQESVTDVQQKLNSGVTIQRSGATSNTLNANVTGTLLLYNGSRVVATKKRLAQLEAMGTHQLEATIQNTIAAVMQKYVELVKQNQLVISIEKSVALSNEQLSLVTLKQSEGLANLADVSQSQIDANNRSRELNWQKMMIHQLRAELLNLLQLSPDSNIVLTDSIQIKEDIQWADVMSALKNNHELLMVQDQLHIDECIVKETAALSKPSFRLNTGYNFNGFNTTAGQLLLNQIKGPFLGVGLTIPIYNGQTFKKQLQVAEINKENTLLKKEKTDNDVMTSAYKMYQTYTTLLQQIKEQEKNCALTEQLLKLSMNRYKLAAATVIELREAQKSFEDAAYTLVSLKYSAKLAEIELGRLTAALNP